MLVPLLLCTGTFMLDCRLMRYLLPLLVPFALSAATIPCSPFTVGPVIFTNCQTVNTVTGAPGLPPMDFNFVPGTFPEPGFPPNEAVLFIPGSYILDPVAFPSPISGLSVTETLSADFSAPGFFVTRVSMSGIAFDDSNITSENIFLNAPCMAVIPGNINGDGSGSAGCNLPGGTQSGTLSVTLDIHSDPCDPTTRLCHGGIVHVSSVRLDLEPVPEPAGLGLMLTGTCLIGLIAVRRRTPFAALS